MLLFSFSRVKSSLSSCAPSFMFCVLILLSHKSIVTQVLINDVAQSTLFKVPFIGPSGISGCAPWATWLDILLVVGGTAAGIILVMRISAYRKQKMAGSQQ